MSIELKIPAVGESITEVQISEWLKAEGDELKQDEAVAVIDSEKTTFELPSPQAGRLAKILHKAGETVRVGEAVAQIESNGQAAKTPPAQKAEPTPAKTPESKTADSEKKPAKPEKSRKEAPPTKEHVADEAVSKTAAPTHQEEEEKETTEILPPASAKEEEPAQPSEEPVQSSVEHEEEVVPMSMLRRTVARRLVEAQQTMAMLTTFNEVDMSAVQALRKEQQEAFEKRHQTKLGLMSFFVKGAIEALKEFPGLNAEIRDRDIVYHNYYDVGVAIATERGLVVPVLRNAARLSFAEIEKTIGDFARRAKMGKLKPEELEGGTFTITNGGVFGSLLSTPIINPPQTGILGMHTIQERPVALAGQVAIRPMMYLALTYDHRLVDGREAVLFLRKIKELLETPARMLLEV